MLDIYLPMAQMSIDLSILLGIGLITGILSGIYGIGGGTISVPLTIFAGIPVDTAVSTSLLQIIGTSSANVFRNILSKNIKYSIGLKIALFTSVGSVIGTLLFNLLKDSGAFFSVIYSLYIILLGGVSFFMLWDIILSAILGTVKKRRTKNMNNHFDIERIEDRKWENVVYKFENFIVSKGIDIEYAEEIKKRSIKKRKMNMWIKCGTIGIFIGLLSGLMGIGGGFILFPAILYIFKESVSVSSMTSSFITLLTTIPACIMQMLSNNLIDPFLAIICATSSAFGVRIGNDLAKIINQNRLKLFFVSFLLFICIRFWIRLFGSFDFMYVVTPV